MKKSESCTGSFHVCTDLLKKVNVSVSKTFCRLVSVLGKGLFDLFFSLELTFGGDLICGSIKKASGVCVAFDSCSFISITDYK